MYRASRIEGMALASRKATKLKRPDKGIRAAMAQPSERPALASDFQALVWRAIQGDSGAFGQLYDRYVARVHRFIIFRVGDPATARDLTQDVFLRALRGIVGLERPEGFETWLMRIAHRTVQNHYRSRDRRPDEVALAAADLTPPTAIGRRAGEDDPDAQLTRSLRGEWVVAAMSELSEAQQEVLGLRFVAGLSFAETAEVCGRSLHAVRKLQYRGLALLRGRGVGPEGEDA
jgi:RNA polymerase sigma-70 factor (ECF subfamily)